MTRKRSTASRVTSSRVVDDFKIIWGIGPLYEKHLHDAGIRTFEQLAKLSPEEIATHIPKLSARQIRSQNWISEARKLISGNAGSKSKKKRGVITTSQHYENFTFEFLLNEKNKLRRLRVVHVQSGDVETWANWDSVEVSHFLTRHTGASIAQAASTLKTPSPKPVAEITEPYQEEKPISDKPVDSPVVPNDTDSQIHPQIIPPNHPLQHIPAAETDQIHLLEWKNLPSNTDQPVSNLPQDQFFDIKLILDLTKTSLPESTQLDVSGSIFAKKMGKGTRQLIGEAQITIPYAPAIDLTISHASLPQGLYRLDAVIKLNPIGANVPMRLDTTFQGGLIQVY